MLASPYFQKMYVRSEDTDNYGFKLLQYPS